MSATVWVILCMAAPPGPAGSVDSPATVSTVAIRVHADRAIAPYRPIWNFFGADEANYVYAPNGKKLLGELAALSSVPVYFRMHNLFTSGDGEASLKWGSTNVYTERPDGSPVYDFTITDRIFDTITAAHVRPIVEIGFMPEALSTHPEPYRHAFPKGDIFTGWTYPPKDWTKWSNLVEEYASHLHQRYGKQVEEWLWEVWNEPDIGYWHGTAEEYDRLYDLSSAAIRRVLPHARVGGPEVTGVHPGRSEGFLRQFLEHCAHGVNAATGGKGAPLDFVSYHPKGSPRFVNGYVEMSLQAQLEAVENGMKVITSYPEWKHTPIILGESDPEGCAACQGSKNGYRNGPLYGVSVADATMRTYELARKYGLTVEGAVTWAFEFENQPPFAGFRELATNGIDKPVLNVFRMMGMLGGGRAGAQWLAVESSGAAPLERILAEGVGLAPDVNAVATRNGREVDVLVWNYHDDDVAQPAAKIRLTMDGLPGNRVDEVEFRMDATHSNAYRAWMQMGSPAQLDPEQGRQLQHAGMLVQIAAEHPIHAADGSAEIDLELPRQGVALIRVREP